MMMIVSIRSVDDYDDADPEDGEIHPRDRGNDPARCDDPTITIGCGSTR